MSSPLSELIDPWRAVEAGAEYAGSLPLARMPRLRESLREANGEAVYRLAFLRDLEGRGVLAGEIDALLVLTCQRCLGAMELEVKASIDLALVSGLDECRLLPEDLDPLLVTQESIRLPDLIEDELLLALPQIPMHEPGECASDEGLAAANDAPEDSGRMHPFAILGALQRKGG
jgi:uncharacterized protein